MPLFTILWTTIERTELKQTDGRCLIKYFMWNISIIVGCHCFKIVCGVSCLDLTTSKIFGNIFLMSMASKKSEERKVRASLKSDLTLPENADDKTCTDNIWYKITGLFSRDTKLTILFGSLFPMNVYLLCPSIIALSMAWQTIACFCLVSFQHYSQ